MSASADPPYKIPIVGNSYVYWLRSFVETMPPASWFADFIVDGSRCDIAFQGDRGVTVDTFLAADMFVPITAGCPDVVCSGRK